MPAANGTQSSSLLSGINSSAVAGAPTSLSVVQSYSYGDSANTNPWISAGTLPSTTTGNLYVACIRVGGGIGVTSVTDTAGNTYTKITASVVTDGTRSLQFWYAANATGNAANAMHVTFSAAETAPIVVFWEISGANAVSPVDTAATGVQASSPSSPITSASYSTSSALGIVLMATTNNANAVVSTGYSPSSGFVQDQTPVSTGFNTFLMAGAHRVPGQILTNVTSSYSYTVGSATGATVSVAAFKP